MRSNGQYQGFGGGWVKPFPKATKKQVKQAQRFGDTVKTLLQQGEMVVPLKYVRKVTSFLRKKKIHFGNFK